MLPRNTLNWIHFALGHGLAAPDEEDAFDRLRLWVWSLSMIRVYFCRCLSFCAKSSLSNVPATMSALSSLSSSKSFSRFLTILSWFFATLSSNCAVTRLRDESSRNSSWAKKWRLIRQAKNRATAFVRRYATAFRCSCATAFRRSPVYYIKGHG